MRKPALVFLLVALGAVLALGVLGARERRSLAFTLGVVSAQAAAELASGQTACQRPVLVEAPFERVELHVGSYGQPGPRLDVTVRALPGDAPVAHGGLAGGYADNSRPQVRVGHVPAGRTVALCVRNDGTRPVALYGGADAAARDSTALVDGRPTGNDLDLVLRRERPASTLALLPDVLERAALFRAGWVGAWVYWALLAAVLIAVPALLAVALRTAGPTPSTAADATPSRARPGSAAGPRSDGTARA